MAGSSDATRLLQWDGMAWEMGSSREGVKRGGGIGGGEGGRGDRGVV